MESTIPRFCISYHNNPGILSPRKLNWDDGVTISSEVPTFDGILGESADFVSGVLIDGSFNYTVKHNKKYGTVEDDGRISGCLGDLNDNLSDIIILTADLPIPHDSINLLGVVGETAIQFMTGYTFVEETKDADIIESFTCFSLEQYILMLLVLLIIAFILKKWSVNGFYDVCSHFFMQVFLDDKRKNCRRILLFSFSLFSFFIFSFYKSLIKTELVVIEKPTVPYTYDDIANDQSLDFIWMPETSNMDEHMSGSPDSSKEKQFYNKIEHKLFKHIANEYRKKNRYHEEYWTYFFNDSIRAHLGKQVLIASESYVSGILIEHCMIKVHSNDKFIKEPYPYVQPSLANKNVWVSSDPDAKDMVIAFIKRTNYKPMKRMVRRITSIFEMGYNDIVMSLLQNQKPYENQFPDLESRNHEMIECIYHSRHLKTMEVGFMPIRMINIWKLNTFCGLFLILSAFILFYEVKRNSKKRKKIKKTTTVWTLYRTDIVILDH